MTYQFFHSLNNEIISMPHNSLSQPQPATIPYISNDASTSSIISKSNIWNHFEKVFEDGIRKSKCKACQKNVHFLRVEILTI